jgi:hypothetical protein
MSEFVEDGDAWMEARDCINRKCRCRAWLDLHDSFEFQANMVKLCTSNAVVVTVKVHLSASKSSVEFCLLGMNLIPKFRVNTFWRCPLFLSGEF